MLVSSPSAGASGVEAQSAHGVEKYEATNIDIVPRDDISVLAPVDHKTLTLLNCYPFYHVGAAPQRFIVTALPPPELTN